MEIIDYKKKPDELLVEFEDGTKKTFPIEQVEEWAAETDKLTWIRESYDPADYDGTYSQRTGEIDFVDFYDVEMGMADIYEFLEWEAAK